MTQVCDVDVPKFYSDFSLKSDVFKKIDSQESFESIKKTPLIPCIAKTTQVLSYFTQCCRGGARHLEGCGCGYGGCCKSTLRLHPSCHSGENG